MLKVNPTPRSVERLSGSPVRYQTRIPTKTEMDAREVHSGACVFVSSFGKKLMIGSVSGRYNELEHRMFKYSFF